jgi:hypothetical protein
MTGSPLNVILRLGYAISEAADMMRIVGVDDDSAVTSSVQNRTQCPLNTSVWMGSSRA